MNASFPPVPSRAVKPQPSRAAFTLVELLVAMTVLLVLILMMVAITNQTNKIWRTSRDRIEAFQGARNAFERITTNLSQATLNTYLDYYNQSGQSRADLMRQYGDTSLQVINFAPFTYDRAADLQFVCGQSQGSPNPDGASPLLPNSSVTRPTHAIFFTCPLGHVSTSTSGSTPAANDFKTLDRVLNAVGYYVEFNNETGAPGFITPAPVSWRYRLMELNQPSESLSLYFSTVVYENPGTWFSTAVDPTLASPPSTAAAPVLSTADNIIALVVRPKVANPSPSGTPVPEIAPYYAYDTKGYKLTAAPSNAKVAKNQLPPLVQVTLVAIDADSAARLANQNGINAPALVDPALFTSPEASGATTDTQYNADLGTLETKLLQLRLNYRVFVTDVSIPGAKWTQTN